MGDVSGKQFLTEQPAGYTILKETGAKE